MSGLSLKEKKQNATPVLRITGIEICELDEG